MNGAEVGAARTYDNTSDAPSTPTLATNFTRTSVGVMMILELAPLSLDISVVGHGVSAQTNAFSQSLFSRPKHRLKIFLRYSAWVRERMNSGAPQDFIGVDIANTSDERLVHEYLLYLSPRLFL